MKFMKLQNLYLLNAALALIFSLGLLFMTPTMLTLFGFNDTAGTRLLAQFIGVELAVGGMVTLLARDVADPKTRSAINYSNLIACVLGFVIALNGTLTGVMNALGYLPVVIYAVLALGFGYFQFFRQAG
ncbi:MAG: hypothetical protein C4557_00515 [Anaerolineaceae bacterium]|jgi:hypothetical protein|nr:MAG: hypothetical protein C4557_00515 [Anaerolineaceae bacterium]